MTIISPSITPKAVCTIHHDGSIIGGHVGGVRLLLVPHRHQAKVSLVSSERTTLSYMAQFPMMVGTIGNAEAEQQS